MAKKYWAAEKKELEDKIKSLKTQLEDERAEASRLRKRISGLEDALKLVPEKTNNRELPRFTIGCNDCRYTGLATESEIQTLIKILCPRCQGNRWTVLR